MTKVARTIKTPSSIKEAERRLTSIDQLMVSKGWERAAILATIVRLGDGRGKRLANEGSLISAVDLAKRGLPGLRDHVTIRLYVQRWLDANDGTYPKPGIDIDLPDKAWPPIDPSDSGTRATPSSIARQLATNPKLAEAAAEEFARPGGAIEHVSRDKVTALGRNVDERRTRDVAADPKPPRISDRNKTAADRLDDEYWARVRQALHLLLDVKVQIRNGITPPADITILMQILVPETDWDQALRDELDRLS